MRLTFLVTSLLLGCASCGSVVTFPGDDDGSGGEHSGAGANGGAIAGSGGSVECASGWRVPGLSRVAIDDPLFRLDSAVATRSGDLMVGYSAWLDGVGTVARKVRAFDTGLAPIGETTTLAERFVGGALGPVMLAPTELGVGVLFWDSEVGPEVAAVRDDGDTLLNIVPVPADGADMFDASGPSSATFVGIGNASDANAQTLFRVTASGVEAIGPLPTAGFHVGRSTFDDGSFLAVWTDDLSEGASGAVHVVAQRFAADTSSLSPIMPVVTEENYGFISPGPRIVSTRSATGVIVGFAHGAFVDIFPLDENGASAGQTVTVSSAGEVGAIALAELDSATWLLVWTTPNDPADALHLAFVDSTTGIVMSAHDLGAGFHQDASPRIGVTADGAAVFATRYDPTDERDLLDATFITRCR